MCTINTKTWTLESIAFQKDRLVTLVCINSKLGSCVHSQLTRTQTFQPTSASNGQKMLQEQRLTMEVEEGEEKGGRRIRSGEEGKGEEEGEEGKGEEEGEEGKGEEEGEEGKGEEEEEEEGGMIKHANTVPSIPPSNQK